MNGSACPKEIGVVHGNDDDGGGHHVEMSLLPLKKRALNDCSAGRGSSSSYSFSSSPKRRLIIDDTTPVVHHREPTAEVAGAASPEPVAEADSLSDAEKLRLSKGKWVVAAEAISVVAPRPNAEKLMHDGIRSGARFNESLILSLVPRDDAVATVVAETKQDDGTDVQTSGARAGPPPRDVPFDSDAALLGEALQRRLAELGATRPSFVFRKRLEKSDVCPNQNRLLVSCKRVSLAGCPVTGCFTPAEMRRVEDRAGLAVTALDGRGGRFPLTCKFLDSNSGYRFISGWGDFLKRNGLVLDGMGMWTRDVNVELWAFRSRELPRQPKLGPGGKPVQGEEEADHFHPDGSLGLVLLHHEKTKKHEKRKGEGARQPGGERKDAKQQRDKRRGAAASSAGRDATSSTAEMFAAFGQSTSLAVLGMLRLRAAMLQRQGNTSGEGAPM